MRRTLLATLGLALVGPALALTLVATRACAGDPPKAGIILSPGGSALSCMVAAREAGYGKADRIRLCQRWAENQRNARREYNPPPRYLGREPTRRWDDRR